MRSLDFSTEGYTYNMGARQGYSAVGETERYSHLATVLVELTHMMLPTKSHARCLMITNVALSVIIVKNEKLGDETRAVEFEKKK